MSNKKARKSNVRIQLQLNNWLLQILQQKQYPLLVVS